MTERLHFHFSLSCIGEGNGNPLHCSCLENPRDGEPGGLPSLGSHRVGHDWNDLAAAAKVVLVWLDWLVLCEYGFSVSALWCPLATPTVLLGFLLTWAWGISSQLLQQSTATAPDPGWGLSPHHRPSWPSTWDGSSRPSCTHAATAPWTWGCSSQPPPVALGVGLLFPVDTPDLRRGVAALGRRPWPRTQGSSSWLFLCCRSLAL